MEADSCENQEEDLTNVGEPPPDEEGWDGMQVDNPKEDMDDASPP